MLDAFVRLSFNYERKEAFIMFTSQRYLTRGVYDTNPPVIQGFIWNCIDCLSDECDYLQVFELKPFGGMQQITHSSEQPEYRKVFLFPSDNPVTAKLYVIDSDTYSTMLLAEEY